MFFKNSSPAVELKAKEEEQQAKKAKKEEKKEEEEDKPADDFRLNDKVTLWSDYLRSYYHHRSVVELPTEYATKGKMSWVTFIKRKIQLGSYQGFPLIPNGSYG